MEAKPYSATGLLAPSTTLSNSLLHAYQSAILAIGSAGAQTTSNLGSGLQCNLLRLHDKLAAEVNAAHVAEVDRKLTQELKQWGDRTSEYFQQKTRQVKEILILMSQWPETCVSSLAEERRP